MDFYITFQVEDYSLLAVQRGEKIAAISRWGELPGTAAKRKETPLLRECQKQIEAYFNGALTKFDLPLCFTGSAFDQSVYRQLVKVPFGHLITYGELAAFVGTSPRAMGGAVGRNPLLLAVPCHRVVAAGNKVGGFSAGMDLKHRLFALEGHRISDDTVLMPDEEMPEQLTL